MKKIINIIIISFFSILLCTLYTFSKTPIKLQTIAVLDFEAKGGVLHDEASIITDRFRTHLVNTGKFEVMERSQMIKILKEQNFQQTGYCSETECSVKIGKLLAVNRLIIGSVTKIGSTYSINVRMINIEKGKILFETYEDCECRIDDVLKLKTKIVADKVVNLTYGNIPGYTPSPAPFIEMVYIPPGVFTMGDNNGDNDEKPVHKVHLNGYYISKYEITQIQYKKFIEQTKRKIPSCDWSPVNKPNYPVVCVDWNDAKAFCAWAGGRLPTEAEWEKAARGTDARKYPWGNSEPNCNFLNYLGCTNSTTAVGAYNAGKSPYGIYDMTGNVWEWANDWYENNYYAHSPSKNPQGPSTGSLRVTRGGSLSYDATDVRCSNRSGSAPAEKFFDVGFRLVK